jgi:hypothetical protein
MKHDARSDKNRAVLQAVHEMHRRDNHDRLSALAGQPEPDIASALSAHVLAQLHGVHVDDPVSYAEAMASEYAEFWKAAMQEEYHSLLENDTWQAADSIVYDKKAIGSKWVYKTKRNPDGSTRFKARLVIKGYEQRRGQDFDETYAPVGKLTTLRYLLGLAAKQRWSITHMDVVTAFLNPSIDRDDVYMALPPGIPFSDSGVVLLRKALYGLKQAPRLWWQLIHGFLVGLGFHQSHADPNLYISDGVHILLYVDDILILTAPGASATADRLKSELAHRFKMTDLGTASQFLGLEISYPGDGTIALGQSSYIAGLLRRFGLSAANGVATPMDYRVRLDVAEGEMLSLEDQGLYLSIVGSLMYAAMATRPDISFAVAALSRYNSAPSSVHLTAAKRVLRYLKQTAHLRLVYSGSANDRDGTGSLEGFTDSDFADDTTDRKSQGAYVFRVLGTAISWQSRKQNMVALSTTEAEYMAFTEAAREALWLRQLHRDLSADGSADLSADLPADDSAEDSAPSAAYTVPIFSDNHGALTTVHSEGQKARTKHFDIRYHAVRDLERKQRLTFGYVPSADNAADVGTKALDKAPHWHMVGLLGLG